jgi:hypothetical protein
MWRSSSVYRWTGLREDDPVLLPLTLVEAFLTAQHVVGEHTAETYRCHLAPCGTYDPTLNETRYAISRTTLTSLLQWEAASPYKEAHPFQAPLLATAEVRQPEGFTIVIPQHAATLTLSGQLLWLHRRYAPPQWEYVPYFDMIPSTPRPLEYHYHFHHSLRRFLELCAFTTASITRFHAAIDPDQDFITVLRTTDRNEQPPAVDDFRVLARLPEFRDNLEAVLIAWFDLYERARPTIDLFGDVLERGYGTTTFTFLALTQAVEVLHRSLHEGTYEPLAAWDGHLTKILAGLPPDLPQLLRDHIRLSLRYANEVSLRARLRQLLADLGDLKDVLELPNDFVRKVVDLRNDQTHFAKDTPEAILQALALTHTLQLFLATYLLHHVHVPEPVIRSGIGQLAHSLRFAQQPSF